MKNLIWFIISKFFKRNGWPFQIFNVDYKKQIKKNKRALLLFKTQSIVSKAYANDFSHTNLFEILEMAKGLNELGYLVDVIDRENKSFTPKKQYDLFLGIAAGDSGDQFLKIANTQKKAIKIPICLGLEPEIKNKKLDERYLSLQKRKKLINISESEKMRKVRNVNFNDVAKISNALLVIGKKQSYTYNSYLKFKKPIFEYSPAIYKKENVTTNNFYNNKFVCFAGNGFIMKGVDLAVEAFLKMPNLDLEIYGPKSDILFNKLYENTIKNSTNITYKGFVNVNTKEFDKMCNSNSFVVLMGSCEGMATSVLTCMMNGLLPIVTTETSVDVQDFGYELSENTPENLIDELIATCIEVSKISNEKFLEKKNKMTNSLRKYNKENFRENFKNTIQNINRNKI